jgi:hypothetical protein
MKQDIPFSRIVKSSNFRNKEGKLHSNLQKKQKKQNKATLEHKSNSWEKVRTLQIHHIKNDENDPWQLHQKDSEDTIKAKLQWFLASNSLKLTIHESTSQ